jgi:hypothetical protein
MPSHCELLVRVVAGEVAEIRHRMGYADTQGSAAIEYAPGHTAAAMSSTVWSEL